MIEQEVFTFDISACTSPAEIHEVIRSSYPLPKYYGNNLDALYECLTDISEPTAAALLFSYTDYDEEDHSLTAYFEKIKKVFLDAEEDNPELAVFIFERY